MITPVKGFNGNSTKHNPTRAYRPKKGGSGKIKNSGNIGAGQKVPDGFSSNTLNTSWVLPHVAGSEIDPSTKDISNDIGNRSNSIEKPEVMATSDLQSDLFDTSNIERSMAAASMKREEKRSL